MKIADIDGFDLFIFLLVAGLTVTTITFTPPAGPCLHQDGGVNSVGSVDAQGSLAKDSENESL